MFVQTVLGVLNTQWPPGILDPIVLYVIFHVYLTLPSYTASVAAKHNITINFSNITGARVSDISTFPSCWLEIR